MASIEADSDAVFDELFQAPPESAEPAAPVNIAGDRFGRLVRKKRAAPARPLVVTGPVSLSDARFTRTMTFRDITFQGDVDIEAGAFTRLDFIDCTFLASLRLPNCRIEGGLSLSRCRFPGPDPTRPGKARLALDGSRLHGRIKFRDLILHGTFSADGVECREIKIDEAEIVGDFRLVSAVTKGDVELFATRIDGHLKARFLNCGGLLKMEKGCSVGKEFNLAGARIVAQLDLADGRFNHIYFNGSAIGSMWIGSSGPIHCRSIWAIDCSFTSYVRMSRTAIGPAALAADAFPGALIGPEEAALEDARAVAAEAEPERRHHSGESGTMVFRHCRFGSLVSTWAFKRGDDIDGTQPDNFVAVEKAVEFTDCDIGGELNLTRLRVGGVGGKAGQVRLDRTHLRGALLISSPLVIAHRLSLPEKARDCARARIERDPDELRASMRSLSMREFSASVVELSGLDLVACGAVDEEDLFDGSLDGERMTVAGRFAIRVHHKLTDAVDPSSQVARAAIPGAMRLRGARIGELHFDAHTFRECENCTARRGGVVLELAEIGLLRVPRLPDAEEEHNGFPVPLNLSGMTVRNWNFDLDLDVRGHAGCSEYLDFLDNDETLHREVYKSVVQSLRDTGRDRDAEKILYAEEYRAQWDTRQARAGLLRPADSQRGRRPDWPRRDWRGRIKGRRGGGWLKPVRRLLRPAGIAIDWGDRYFLGYRRNPINLFYLMVGLFALSLILVSGHPSNFELSDRSRTILQLEHGRPTGLAAGIEYGIAGRNAGPNPAYWSWDNRIWMATRYHVPIISIAVQDEFVASNDNPLTIGALGLNVRWPWLTAEDWFGFMSLLNWITWPLLLTFLLRRALRSD